jgi:hypothetical protein
MERRLQQQGVPRQRNPLDQQLPFHLHRREGGSNENADRGGYGSRLLASGTGRTSDRITNCATATDDGLYEPQACKALMAYLMEADQFNKWLYASQGFFSHTLNTYAANPVWTDDPKRTAFRDAANRSLTTGGLGSVGGKAANAFSDFVLVDMFANFCLGREDAKGAIKIAERQLRRIYR